MTGIQSKSVFKNSEQIVNNYFNSEYECGLGTIIDFENKKILNYGVALEFNGTEKWAMGDGYARDDGYYSCIYVSLLSQKEMRARGVVTDGRIDPAGHYADGLWWIGVSSNVLYILGAERYFHLTQFANSNEPTPQEKETLLAEWKAYLTKRYEDGNPVRMRYISSTLQSEEPLNENDIITTFNQCTQKPIYSTDQDIVSKIPLKIKQEVVLTNQRESTTPLKPLTPASTAANLVEGSGGDYGLHTYTFSGNCDFVYNEPIVLDYNEKLVAEFAINPTSSNYLTGDGWLAIALGNIPPAGMESYPQTSYNMVTYSAMRQVIWGSTAVSGKTSFKTGFSEIYPNEFGNSNLNSYYYKVEVTRVDLNLYNYRLSRLRKGVENSYEVIDEIQDIKANGNSAGIPSYYIQSIMIAGLGHKLTLGGLRFYKAQL